MHRFNILEKKKLNKDPILAQKYRDLFNGHIKNGYARKLTPDESKKRTDITNYMPHHSVIHPSKPNKIRFVFNAGAKFNNTSLNDNLFFKRDSVWENL